MSTNETMRGVVPTSPACKNCAEGFTLSAVHLQILNPPESIAV